MRYVLLSTTLGYETHANDVLQNVMPPTINLDRLADGFDCNYAAGEAQERRIDVALTNSFGFGGTNSSLCFSRV